MERVSVRRLVLLPAVSDMRSSGFWRSFRMNQIRPEIQWGTRITGKLSMKTRCLHVSLCMAVLLVVVVCSAVTVGQSMEGDPVWAVIKEYERASDELREQKNLSTDDRVAWMRKWKERFQTVVDQNPKNTGIEVVKIELLGLSNGLGEYDDSQKILDGMISQTDNIEAKIRWYNESGEVAEAKYGTHKDPNEAQKALAAFEKSQNLYLSLPASSQNNVEIGGRQIVSLCRAGRISSSLEDHTKSAALYQSAQELFQSSPECAMRAALMNYDLEGITAFEMIEWVHAKNESKSLSCLDILSKLDSYRWPPSHYALQYANLQYENDSKGFRNFVSKWLDQHAFDERTPILMAQLGFSYNRDGLHEKALPIYETLRDKHRGDFQKLEPDAFQRGKGGHYAKILSDLAIIYLRQGRVGDAEKVKNELAKQLPKSPDIENLTPKHFSADLASFPLPAQEINRSFFMRAMFMVTGVILIVLGFYFGRIKRAIKK